MPKQVHFNFTKLKFSANVQLQRLELKLKSLSHFAPYLTAAKRTLMLDSDRPLTILSIMFSVSVI